MQNIVLIGFMGSGKSSLGREIAKQSERYFLDTDSLIESSLNKSVSKIFTHFGEEEFRRQEGVLLRWLSVNVKNAVISTGGGMPIFHNVRDLGVVFYLEIAFEQILARLGADTQSTRPLFSDENKARELYVSRLARYKEQAHFTLNAVKPLEILTKEILDLSFNQA
ncbi:shikimate kinase [Helicobacter himalayensis]|uniref:shikimate kinase n=1 Tax=Helicobacter himalayensis TaxID=1591088 RepID=UPI003D6EC2E2